MVHAQYLLAVVVKAYNMKVKGQSTQEVKKNAYFNWTIISKQKMNPQTNNEGKGEWNLLSFPIQVLPRWKVVVIGF